MDDGDAQATQDVWPEGDDPWAEVHEVTGAEGIELLTNLKALRYLMPFLRQAHTLTSASRELGRSTGAVAYWIPKLHDAGLIVHLGDERRGGRAMPRYRAAAKLLRIPFARVPFDRRVALLDGGRTRVLRRFLDGIDEALADDHGFALGFSSPPGAGVSITMLDDEDPTPVRGYTDGWSGIRLDEDDAKALAQEMEELIERYSNRTGARQYLAHVGLAPDPRFRWRSAVDELPS